jgi:hypothetical protein
MCNKSKDFLVSVQEQRAVFCSPLDTNEQVRKISKKQESNGGGVVPEQSEGVSRNVLKSKCWKIAKKNSVASPMIDYAKSVDSPNIAQYRAVLLCGRYLAQSDNKFLRQLFYCGSKLCPICSNIRSQKVADLVLSAISLKEEWCMLTLTNSNNSINYQIDNLIKRLSAESKWFVKVRDKWRKRLGDFSAIVSLEIIPPGYKQYSKSGGVYYADFHPHYHILTTKDFAEFLKQEWLKSFDTALEINQKICLVSDRAKDKKISYTLALRDTIREVVKYSLKACLPKIKDNGSVCLNCEGIDDIMTMMKGRRRLKMWGNFHNIKGSVTAVEDKDISELDLNKVVYNDLPVQDTGEMVESTDWRGRPMAMVPEFVKEVVWSFDDKKQNYYYVDEFGDEHCLVPEYKRRDIKVMICRGRKIIKHQIF